MVDAAENVKEFKVEQHEVEEGGETNRAVVDEQQHQTPLRKSLPFKMIRHNLSLWQLFKASIGRDLTHVNMPLEIFEPLSVLQVFCEELEYSELLDRATKEADPYKRMALVASFAVSRYAATTMRGIGKPFNPLEGETYECIREDLGWRFLSEQVNHEPGVTACHAQGRGWVMMQSAMFKLSVTLSLHLEATPTTPVDVVLTDFRETYRWNKVTSAVYNLFSDNKRHLDHFGEMIVECSSGIKCKIKFKKITHDISGSVKDLNNSAVHTISGKWSDYINYDKERIWTIHPFSRYAAEQYGFSDFAVTLNQLTTNMLKHLPPTDTRFRPDQKLLEEGKLEEGKMAKARLEVEQRKRRKLRKHYVPKWFSDNTPAGNKYKDMHFNKRYWEARKNHFQGEKFDKLW